jgi:molybdopterin molybdotransferase
MITVNEARTRILAGLHLAGTESVMLANAAGRVLAAPIQARLAQPPADVSAMDGYAVRAADAQPGASLRLIGQAPAGRPFAGGVQPGETVRIFTGSYIPAGTDSVLIQENATATNTGIIVNEACTAGRHIRRTGQDFALGDTLLTGSRRLTSRDIGLAAAGNHPWLTVYRRPRIAILSTGDEISLPGEPIGPGGIVNSNAVMLAAFATTCGADPIILPIASDDPASIAAGATAARGADLLITTGGASVGAHDLVQAGLAQHGFVLDFWKIAMRPGKPLIFGHVGGMPVLGLPGNPVSAFVCAVLFLAPAIAAMTGLPDTAPVLEQARLAGSLPENDSREDYLRARLQTAEDGLIVATLTGQDSGMLTPLAKANALLRRPPFQEALAPGALVEIIRLTL